MCYVLVMLIIYIRVDKWQNIIATYECRFALFSLGHVSNIEISNWSFASHSMFEWDMFAHISSLPCPRYLNITYCYLQRLVKFMITSFQYWFLEHAALRFLCTICHSTKLMCFNLYFKYNVPCFPHPWLSVS